ncbi:Alpha/Beta hydrolase protein [Chiua virens]|nr:Alpha/Beta hydrolase protein [Chiua virens]
MTALFASTWGNPNATKRVLLIHGLSVSSTTWHQADVGWFVTAPDFFGHGHAKLGSDYTIAALANNLLPFLTPTTEDDHPYDIVIGHSLGGVIVAALLPHLKSTRPVHVVLVDPPLFEVTPEFHAMVTKEVVERLKHPKSPERYQQFMVKLGGWQCLQVPE